MDTDALVAMACHGAQADAEAQMREWGVSKEQDRLRFELRALKNRLRFVLETIESAARLELSASYVAAELVAMETQRAELREGAAHATA